MFFPSYNWYFAIRFEYVVHFLTFAMLVLLLDTLLPKLYSRYVLRAYYVLSGAFILLTIFLAPKVFTGLLIIFNVASVLMILYTLARLGMQLREKKPQNILALTGIALVCLFGVIDILVRNNVILTGVIARQEFATPIAMLFFVFCYGLVISLDYAETEQKMMTAQLQVQEAEARFNEILEKQSNNKPHAAPSDFKLSHRETDVLWLLLDGKSRQEITDLLDISMGSVNTYCNRIYHKTNTSGIGGFFFVYGFSRLRERSERDGEPPAIKQGSVHGGVVMIHGTALRSHDAAAAGQAMPTISHCKKLYSGMQRHYLNW